MINKIFSFNPFLLIILSNIILFDLYKIQLIMFYNVGYYLCITINKKLKNIIKDRRPYWNYEKSLYNMPSGHCMAVFYSIAYIQYNPFHILVGITTIFNCIYYRYHTIDQIIVGSILGLVYGHYYLNFTRLFLNV